MEISFKGGLNITMKIPPKKYDETVAFYKNVLLFDVEEVPIEHPTILATHRLRFGQNILWLHAVKELTDTKICMELCTDDIKSATNYLRVNDIPVSDEVGEVNLSMNWIKDPTGNTLLLKQSE